MYVCVCVCVCFLAVLVWLIWRIISCQLLQIQLACLYCLLCQAEGGSCLLLEGKGILHTANRVSNLFLSWSQTLRSLLNSLQWLQQQSHLQIPCLLKWIKLQMSTSCKERTSSSIPHPHNTTHPQKQNTNKNKISSSNLINLTNVVSDSHHKKNKSIIIIMFKQQQQHYADHQRRKRRRKWPSKWGFELWSQQGERKKTHHDWIQCGDFHCQHHKGGSITAASHHHPSQDPRPKIQDPFQIFPETTRTR